MIIDEKRYAKIMVSNPEGEVIAVLTDRGPAVAKGYSVKVEVDDSPGPDAIALRGDMLYYTDDPDHRYVVVSADEKFFLMCPVTVEADKSITVNNRHPRTYPNDQKVGKLEDFGLYKDFDIREVTESDNHEK